MTIPERDQVLIRVIENIQKGTESTPEDLKIVEDFKAYSEENRIWFDKWADPELPKKLARLTIKGVYERYQFTCIVSALYHLRTHKPLLYAQQQELEDWIAKDPFHAQFVFEFTEGRLKRLAMYLFDRSSNLDWSPPDPRLDAYLKQSEYETNINHPVGDGSD
jgi:hypothetical protein